AFVISNVGLRRKRQPGSRSLGRRPTVVAGAVPRDRGAASVAPSWVDCTIRGDDGVEQSQLLSLEEERGPPEGQQQHRGRPGPGLAPPCPGGIVLACRRGRPVVAGAV